jgi:glutamate/aspartate transport system substrate-binding protein
MQHVRSVMWLLPLTFFATALQVQAQSNGTLEKLKAGGVITIGYRESSIPFSYLDDKAQVVGYSIDICSKIVESLRLKEALKLETKLITVTSSTRIPLLANGTIDLECGSTTNTADRQQQVAFSFTTYVASSNFVTKKSSGIRSYGDFKGRTIVSTAGTTDLKLIHALNNDKKLAMNVLSAKDHAEAFLMVQTGRADAFVMDDVLLAGQVANSSHPEDYTISEDFLSLEPYGIMIRRDDTDFKHAVDEAIRDLFASGAIKTIYAKWFTSPIPPRGISLNLPMSQVLQHVVSNPTDASDPAAYK